MLRRAMSGLASTAAGWPGSSSFAGRPPPYSWAGGRAGRAGRRRAGRRGLCSASAAAEAGDPDLHLEGLNAEQYAAVTCPVGRPQRVLAGPGSGKTRVLTSRVAHLVLEGGVEARSVVCLTFTNKAALEMQERLARVLGPERASAVRAGTFHRVCCYLLRTYLPVERTSAKGAGTRSREFTIYDAQDSERVVGELLRELVDKGKEGGVVPGLDGDVLKCAGIVTKGIVKSYIGARKTRMESPAAAKRAAQGLDKKFWSRNRVLEEQLKAYLYGRYQAALDEADALDFDDLLLEALKMLQRDPDLLARVRARYRHVLVDEFQDTNATQYQIAQLLAAESRSLFVVGDTDQSIYGWRGAITAANMRKLQADFPELETLTLASNYRSTPQILAFAKELLAGGGGEGEKGMSSIGAQLVSERQAGPRVEVLAADSSLVEATAVAGEILDLQASAGVAFKDMAVLYRTHQQTIPFESAFRRLGIPYVVVGGTPFFGRMEIKDLLSFLRLVYRPDDSLALDRIYNVPKRGLGDVAYAKLKAWAAEQGAGGLASALARLPLTGDGKGIDGGLPKEITPRARSAVATLMEDLGACRAELERGGTVSGLIEAVIARTGYYAYVEKLEERDVKAFKKSAKGTSDADKNADTRKQNIEELLDIARRHDAKMAAEAAADRGEAPSSGALSGVSSLRDFLEATVLNEQLSVLEVEGQDDEVLSSDQVRAQDKVRLMTLHGSKGLEFGAVFMVGMEEGRLPLVSNEDVEEERRLAYVGMTRAKDRLYLSHAKETTQYGELKKMTRSSFLDDVLQDKGTRKGNDIRPPAHASRRTP